MSAQWPRVIDQLVTVAPTLDGWNSGVSVFDGPPDKAEAELDYLTVGYVEDDQAGTYTLTQNDDGWQWNETGTIRSQLTCRSGDTDVPANRVRAFELADAFEAYVRADRTLGGTLSPEGTTDLSVEVLSAQSSNGANFQLVLTLTYFTVT